MSLTNLWDDVVDRSLLTVNARRLAVGQSEAGQWHGEPLVADAPATTAWTSPAPDPVPEIGEPLSPRVGIGAAKRLILVEDTRLVARLSSNSDDVHVVLAVDPGADPMKPANRYGEICHEVVGGELEAVPMVRLGEVTQRTIWWYSAGGDSCRVVIFDRASGLDYLELSQHYD